MSGSLLITAVGGGASVGQKQPRQAALAAAGQRPGDHDRRQRCRTLHGMSQHGSRQPSEKASHEGRCLHLIWIARRPRRPDRSSPQEGDRGCPGATARQVLATARQAQRERQPSGKPTTSPPRVIPPEYGPDTIQRPRPNTPEGQWSTNTTCNGPPPAALPHRQANAAPWVHCSSDDYGSRVERRDGCHPVHGDGVPSVLGLVGRRVLAGLLA